MAIRIGHINIEAQDIKFEDMKLGDNAEFEHSFYMEDMKKFTELSGNYNPLHLDEEYAKRTQFKRPILYGMLTASLFSKLLGMYIPGRRALCLAQTLNFCKPVFVGEKLKVRGEVIAKSESTRIITIKTTVLNKNNETVLHGEAKVQVL